MDKAKETLTKVFGSVKGKWETTSKNARIVTMAVSAALVFAIIIVVIISGQTNYEVLYTEVPSLEIGEIIGVLRDDLGMDFRTEGNKILVPREQLEQARISLSIMGYPKGTFNYDIWDNSVGMFSTDMEKNVALLHTLEQKIRATLLNTTNIVTADVIISLAEKDRFVLNPQSAPAQASVRVTLKDRLRDEEIEGIKKLIMFAVPNLTLENLTLTDQNGAELIPQDANNAEVQLALASQKLKMQMDLQNSMAKSLEARVEKVLNGMVKKANVSVTLQLDFTNWSEKETSYSGTNIDPETGMQTGIVDWEQSKAAANGYAPDGGLVGAPVDADISPGYPTWLGDIEGEFFYEAVKETHYMVNEVIRQVENEGIVINKLSCGVAIDSNPMTQDETDRITALVANTISADVENVTVYPTNFQPDQTSGHQDFGTVVSPVRNLLVFIIISLGALLIILFMLAIMSSGSKKRRLIKARAAMAHSGAGGDITPGYADEGFSTFSIGKQHEEEDESLKIQSLLGGEGETRDALLKNEIREFAKTNPDIVAQLIRTWIREE